jgi:hypothetical protein
MSNVNIQYGEKLTPSGIIIPRPELIKSSENKDSGSQWRNIGWKFLPLTISTIPDAKIGLVVGDGCSKDKDE